MTSVLMRFRVLYKDCISVVYDASTHPNPILKGVDNITLNLDGELVIGEDGGNMQVVLLTSSNELIPLAQIVGHGTSENGT